LDACTGEAFVNRRKGKVIPSYELSVKLCWEGTSADGAASGNANLPYIADENAGEPESLEVRFTSPGDSPAERACKETLQKKALPLIRSAVATWISEMTAGGPGGAGPSAGGAGPPGAGADSSFKPPPKPAAAAPPPKPEPVGGFTSITVDERFFCRPADIYEALTVPARVKAYTQSDCTVSTEPGARFSLFSGNVEGENVEMVPPTLIVQRWRFRNWAEGVYSTLRIELSEPEHGTTVLKLQQTGVPVADAFGNEARMAECAAASAMLTPLFAERGGDNAGGLEGQRLQPHPQSVRLRMLAICACVLFFSLIRGASDYNKIEDQAYRWSVLIQPPRPGRSQFSAHQLEPHGTSAGTVSSSPPSLR
jgi:activator of HSP90 ATPase